MACVIFMDMLCLNHGRSFADVGYQLWHKQLKYVVNISFYRPTEWLSTRARQILMVQPNLIGTKDNAKTRRKSKNFGTTFTKMELPNIENSRWSYFAFTVRNDIFIL